MLKLEFCDRPRLNVGQGLVWFATHNGVCRPGHPCAQFPGYMPEVTLEAGGIPVVR